MSTPTLDSKSQPKPRGLLSLAQLFLRECLNPDRRGFPLFFRQGRFGPCHGVKNFRAWTLLAKDKTL